MLKRFVLSLITFYSLTVSAFAAQPFTLLFFNDFHAHVEPFKVPGQEGEVGGIARLAGLADEVRAANKAAGVPTYLLVAGDAFTGTPYSSVFKGEVEFACLNAMGVDAMCLGNHEFDYGHTRVSELLKTAVFPVLAANVTEGDGAAVKPYAGNVARLDADGKKILIVGLTTPATPVTTMPANVAGLTFADPAATAAAMVAADGEQADVIVALTHIGFEEDVKLARAVPALDVIIGGHSHTKVDNV
jgi:5'-nucleotidase/UDP-sugar diphosphatase